MNFSERFGFEKEKENQLNSMSPELSNDIFNFFDNYYFDFNVNNDTDSGIALETMCYNIKKIWQDFFHSYLEELYTSNSQYTSEIDLDRSKIKVRYDELPFNRKYDFLEFILQYLLPLRKDFEKINFNFSLEDRQKIMLTYVNKMLEHGFSGYRFTEKMVLVSITNEKELSSINKSVSSQIDGGNISKAINEISKRENADPETIIGESIKGVESAANHIIKEFCGERSDKTLSQAIKIMGKHKILDDHPALFQSLDKLYAYASDSGIRHGKSETNDYDIDLSDANFILVTCSAFVNLMKQKIIYLEQNKKRPAN